MPNQFYKGRSLNALTWLAPDSTDFATPESAMSAAQKLAIYGRLRSTSLVYFVSSGTGSMAGGDIKHVGPSALGVYTVPLSKADLSDASAAWYDQYICIITGTGMAQQTLIVDGGIDLSAASAYQSRLSDIMSALLLAQSMASDAHSAAAQANSRVLLVLSNVSDVQSYLVAMSGMLSDTHSAAILGASNASEAQSHATLAASRILLVQSRLSDLDSRLMSEFSDVYSRLSDMHSDLGSKIGAITVSLDASAISDIASAVLAGMTFGSVISDAHSAAAQANSRILLIQSRLSDFNSAFVSQLSDFRSDLTSYLLTTGVGLNASTMSDLRSAVLSLSAMLSDAHSAAAQANSRALVIQSIASDTYSLASNINSATLVAADTSDFASAVLAEFASDLSDIKSAIAAVTATVSASDMSDIASRVDVLLASRLSDILSAAQQTNSRVLLNQSRISDAYSMLSDAFSDLKSQLTVVQSMASDAASAAAQGNSRILVVQSQASDLASKLSDVESNLLSVIGTTGVQLNASTLSDIRSAITAGATGLDASALSDIVSGVVAAIGGSIEIGASSMSDLRSAILSLSAMLSDTHSAATAGASRALVAQSMASDAHSAAAQGSSRALLLLSQVSDVYSLLSDLHSDVAVMSAVVSDIRSDLSRGVDVRAINGTTLTGNGASTPWGPA